MMETQAKAIAMQSIPPLWIFSGDDADTDDGSFERWFEGFKERAKIYQWDEDQKLFQLKAHLQKTTEHVVRMLPAKDKGKYDTVVEALRSQFRSLDIEELKGREFH
jgi:hypothetical protein